MNVRVAYKPADNPGRYTQSPIDIGWMPIPIEPYREYKVAPHQPKLGYEIPAVVSTEDAIVMDSMPKIADRERENLLPVGDTACGNCARCIGARWKPCKPAAIRRRRSATKRESGDRRAQL